MTDYRKMYETLICERLEEYGYAPGMYPKKYTRYTQVSGTIKIRLSAVLLPKDIPYHGNKQITEKFYDEAVQVLDIILPHIDRQE